MKPSLQLQKHLLVREQGVAKQQIATALQKELKSLCMHQLKRLID